jgi:O-antigen ligase
MPERSLTSADTGAVNALNVEQSTGFDVSPATAGWKTKMDRLAFGLSWGSAVSILFSIALSQTLLGMALIALLLRRKPLRFPPIRLPLALFFLTTVAAVLASSDPRGGLPQIRKFFIFAIVLVVFNTFRTMQQIRSVLWAWGGLALLSSIASFAQLWHRHQLAIEQNANDYGFYLDGRNTGLASHWMTFGGEQMIVFLMLLSLVCFSRDRVGSIFARIILPILWLSIVLGLTRSIFLFAVPIGVLYILWGWKRWMIGALAVILAVVSIAAPFYVRDRALSVFKPHQELDSNLRRVIMVRTGLEMIKSHPWLGIGPEQIKPQFTNYVPRDVSRPLPKGWYGHLHNMYLQYAAERGIVALLLLLWLIAKAIRDFHTFLRAGKAGLRAGKVGEDTAYLLRGAIAVILAILAEGFFEYNLGDSEVLTMFLVVLSFGYIITGRGTGCESTQLQNVN